tara:strand:+ start:3090 stop:3284 length:195 start_codon:yes stop_codon:yes gene_type:complete
MFTKKEIKEKLKQTETIERMLLMFLSEPSTPEEQAHMLVGELLAASEFIVRFKDCLKEMKKEGK